MLSKLLKSPYLHRVFELDTTNSAILEFSVSNFQSILKKQTIQFFTKNTPSNVTVLFGGNNVGKSHFLSAILLMQNIVVNSEDYFDKVQTHKNNSDKTEFEIIFMLNGIKHQYGFSVIQTQCPDANLENFIHEEWLYTYPDGKAHRVLSRNTSLNSEDVFRIDTTESKKLVKGWKECTRENRLFLSTASQLNSVQFGEIFQWFSKMLKSLTPKTSPLPVFDLCKTIAGKNKVLEYLQNFVDIDFIEIISSPYGDIAGIGFEGDENGLYQVNKESSGINYLFNTAYEYINVLENGGVLIVDNFGDFLHSNISQKLISLFTDIETNPKNAQLIFATVYNGLLNDQCNCYSVIKNKNQETIVTLTP